MGTLAEARTKGSDRSPLFDFCGQASSLVAIRIRRACAKGISMSEFDRYVFIDESGNDGMLVEGDGTSSHYVLAGIVVAPGDLQGVRQHFYRVKGERFPQAKEMKSEFIGNNNERRRVVLLDLVHPNYSLYLLVVDKLRLESKGFQYPKSFVKCLVDRLISEVLRDAPNACVRCDDIKNADFMAEFKRYIFRQHPVGLLDSWDFDFVHSGSEICVQAADVIAGSVARCWERARQSPMSDEFMHILEGHIDKGVFATFPRPKGSYVHEMTMEESGNYSEAVERRALDEAYRFIDRHGASEDRERKAQVEFAKALLEYNYLQSRSSWLSTEDLRQRYRDRFGEDLGDQKLRGIIGSLRDAGLLITSRSAGGYKLPTCEADLYEFLNNYNSKIAPMVVRIRKARETIKRATDTQLDILAKQEFENLRRAVNATPEWKMHKGVKFLDEEESIE